MKQTEKLASREGRENRRDGTRQREELGKKFCRRRSERGDPWRSVGLYKGFDG
jgi:hypothetical protein